MAIGPREARKKFFHLHFSVVWIGCRSTFVLCTALLTAEYAEGDRAQLEGQQRPQLSSFISIINLQDTWLATGCESLVVVNKLGGVECVRLLLNRELHVVSSVV